MRVGGGGGGVGGGRLLRASIDASNRDDNVHIIYNEEMALALMLLMAMA